MLHLLCRMCRGLALLAAWTVTAFVISALLSDVILCNKEERRERTQRAV